MNNIPLKKISLILFAVALFLLIANIIIDKVIEKKEVPRNRESLTGLEIDLLFHDALKNYGLSDSWIKKKKIKNVSGDSLYASYVVKVPKDVPIPLLLLELQDLLWENEVETNSGEIIAGNNTIVMLSSEEYLKLAAEFSYDDNLKREYGTVSFLVNNLPADNEAKLNELLNTAEPFYVVLVPSEKDKKFLPLLIKSNRRYALLINDEIKELTYKLSEKYSESRLKSSIRSIVGAFHYAVFFIIDDKSDLFSSDIYKLVEAEFIKRGIALSMKSRLVPFSSNNFNSEKNFEDFMLSVQKNDEKILLISSDEFMSIIPLISSYRKIGYRFIYPGDLIVTR